MRRLAWFGGWTMMLLFGAATTVLAEEAGVAAEAASVMVVLAPLVAAATAIERVIEMLFDMVESSIRQVGSFLGIGKNYFGWANEIAVEARATAQAAGQALLKKRPVAAAVDDASLPPLRVAENALDVAEGRLNDLLKSPKYMAVKRMVSLALGIVLGVVAANLARIRMFGMLGIALAPENATAWAVALVERLDMTLTGLVIGTGSAPVHSLIGILQNSKRAVEAGRDLWSGKSTAEVQEVLAALLSEQAAARGGKVGARELGEEPALPTPVEVRRAARAILR